MHILRVLCKNVTSRCEVNGLIECSVRQGCPLSMIMYAVVLKQFLTSYAENLEGLKRRPASSHVSVFAYADNITIILTSPAVVKAVRTALHLYQRAAGASLNLKKSKPYYWADGTLSLNQWTCLTHKNRNLGYQITCDDRKTSRCIWSSIFT